MRSVEDAGGRGQAGGNEEPGRPEPQEGAELIRRLASLLRRELEAEGLAVEKARHGGEPVLVVGELRLFPRRLLAAQAAAAGGAEAVDFDQVVRAHRAHFRNLRRFHPSLVMRTGA